MIDERTNTIDFRITVGVEPEGVTVDPLTDAAYVANTQSGTISVTDTVLTLQAPTGGYTSRMNRAAGLRRARVCGRMYFFWSSCCPLPRRVK